METRRGGPALGYVLSRGWSTLAHSLSPHTVVSQSALFNRKAVSAVVLQKLVNRLEGTVYDAEQAATVRSAPAARRRRSAGGVLSRCEPDSPARRPEEARVDRPLSCSGPTS